MTLKLGNYLDAINMSKENLLVDAETTKGYPAFVVSRSLSYHRSCIPLLDLLNKANVLDNNMHNDFLLYTIPKGKKYAKWAKPEKFELVDHVARYFECSKHKAIEYMAFLSDEDLKKITAKFDEGGIKK